MQLTQYHAKYFAHELTRRVTANSVEKLSKALSNAQVDLNPHQVEAALFAFYSPLSNGAILADEVGLGKTIEAGIVIAQKWAERKRKILIITPANLRKQWNLELLDKFFLPSIILESASFKEFKKNGNATPFVQQDAIVITSIQFAASYSAAIKDVEWDLVVIDEAHRLRNTYKTEGVGRNGMPKKPNLASQIKVATAHCKKLLLTATPLQNTLLELYGLVSIIDQHTFGDIKSFRQQFSRLTGEEEFEDLRNRIRPLCHRTLRRQVQHYIKYTKRSALVQPFEPGQDEQDLYNLVSEYLRRENLWALPASQRKLMTLVLRKLLASSTFAIGGTLQGLADKLKQFLTENSAEVSAVDALAGDFEALGDIREDWKEKTGGPILETEQETEPEEEAPEEPQETDTGIALSREDREAILREIADLEDFAGLARSITRNSKGEQLLIALKEGVAKAEALAKAQMQAEQASGKISPEEAEALIGRRIGANKKAIIFTESTRTQKYLLQLLENDGYGGRIVLFNGTNQDPQSREVYKQWLAANRNTDRVTGSPTADMRTALVDKFRNEAMIMIATEAAAEGINLQFCSLIVNFDMPWNPQRIEQRIGRCHRYGQKFDVVVVNFLNLHNAADQRVYEILDRKFNLFNGVFGASDEVLGAITSGVDFEKRIAEIYQHCRSEQEIDKAFADLDEQFREEKTARLADTRQKLFENIDTVVIERLRISKEQSEQALSQYENRLWQLTQWWLGDKARFDEPRKAFVLQQAPVAGLDVPLGVYRMGAHVSDAHVYRFGHPLAQKIVEACRTLELPAAEVTFNHTDVPGKISILEPLVGQGGWLRAQLVTFQSFEEEDVILLAGLTDAGDALDQEQAALLFTRPGRETGPAGVPPESVTTGLRTIIDRETDAHRQKVGEQNNRFFQLEIEKLTHWADDQVKSLERELEDTKAQIRDLNRQSRAAQAPQEQLRIQKELLALNTQQTKLRRSIFEAEDTIGARREEMIKQIEGRLKMRVHPTNLFLIRWRLT